MERYIFRERRVGAEYPEGNQMIAFSATSTGNNITIPGNVYYKAYSGDTPNINMHYPAPGLVPLPAQSYLPNVIQAQDHGQIVSGIEPRYLAAFTDNNARYIATGQQQVESKPIPINAFGSDYQNHNFIVAERTDNKRCAPQRIPNVELTKLRHTSSQIASMPPRAIACLKPVKIENQQTIPATTIEETVRNQGDTDLSKNEVQYQVKTRAEKLKELHKSGTRVFCGPVEDILKWHKSLQDIGIMILFEIVGKCVSVREGESCAKNLVVRDDNGPAIQVVYYEIEYLLPELTIPCTVRVIGRIQPRTIRLQAFNVRPATGDDVAALPRRAAVSSHHVAKLCKEFN